MADGSPQNHAVTTMKKTLYWSDVVTPPESTLDSVRRLSYHMLLLPSAVRPIILSYGLRISASVYNLYICPNSVRLSVTLARGGQAMCLKWRLRTVASMPSSNLWHSEAEICKQRYEGWRQIA